jgi:hypothetical protein
LRKRILVAALVGLSAFSFGQSADIGSVRVGLRSFGGNEGLEYLNLAAQGDLGAGFKAEVAGTFSQTSTFYGNGFKINHGGNDFEIRGIYAPRQMPFELSLGLGLANTPERSEGVLTFRGAYDLLPVGPNRLAVEAYGVATPNPLVVAGLTDSFTSGALSYDVSAGLPVRGTNSVSTNTGDRNRVALYSVGAAYSLGRSSTLRLAITDQLGWTTGMMATPALGGQPGLEIALKVRI